MAEAEQITIEVAYAEPLRAIVKTYRLPLAATAEMALLAAAADSDFDGIDVVRASVGIFGKAVGKSEPLRAGDRVEIYRPLAEDPKLARRERVKRARRQS